MEFFESFLKVLKALQVEQVQYILIGGFAVIIHGMPRVTQDIDVFVDMEPENIERLKKALNSVFDDKSIDEITLNDLTEYSVIRYGTPEGFYIDILGKLGEFASYKDLEYELIDIEGVEIRVADIETLYWLKKDTLRLEDKRDAVFLAELISRKELK